MFYVLFFIFSAKIVWEYNLSKRIGQMGEMYRRKRFLYVQNGFLMGKFRGLFNQQFFPMVWNENLIVSSIFEQNIYNEKLW
jgi:hypothetical protein